MPRLLYLENSPGSDGRTGIADRLAAMGVDVELWRAYRNEFPIDLAGYSGVYLTGSSHGAYDDVSWIHREHKLIQDFAARDMPMLGVCFGSQILASALCGREQVFRRSTCEVGYVALSLTKRAVGDELMVGIGASVRMFVWHNDEVNAAHPDMRVLAWSPDCPNHIWRYRDRLIWGIQGHPEVTPTVARAWLEQNRPTLEEDRADVEALIRDPGADPEVDLFVANFVDATERATSHLARPSR